MITSFFPSFLDCSFAYVAGRDGKPSAFKPVESLQAFKIVDVACGDGFTVAITNTGKLSGFGKNSQGELGLGHREPTRLPKISPVLDSRMRLIQITAGEGHCLALTSAGDVLSWGQNRHGVCGLYRVTTISCHVFSCHVVPIFSSLPRCGCLTLLLLITILLHSMYYDS